MLKSHELIAEANADSRRAGVRETRVEHEDGPDSPLLNPFVNIMSAVTYPGRPKEALTRQQAVVAAARTAAYAEFAEADKGSIEPGKFADVAVLSQDIFEVPVNDLPKTESVLTIVGGRIVHDGMANTGLKH